MSGIVVLPIVVPKAIVLAGVTGTRSRQNQRIRNQGGFVSVNVIRDYTLRAWQIGTGPMSLSVAEQVFGLQEATDAGAYGMLYEDPIDFTTTAANGALQGYMSSVEFGVASRGNGTPNYGFRKLYPAFGSAYQRARGVTRLNGTPVVMRDGVPVVVGGSAGNIAISAGPSYVTFVPDTTRSVSSVIVGATTTIALSSAIPGFVVGGRLWLQDLTGADAALLNNKSHEITNIAGAVYTLDVNTVGKTITASGGEGHKYPQPSESLTWVGSFYVPVNFRDDTIDWELVVAGASAKRQVVIPQTFLDEIRET